MKRVLLVTTSYPDCMEGPAAAGVFVRDFAAGLTDAGVDVDVVAPTTGVGLNRDDGLSVSRFAVPRLPLSLLSPVRLRDWRSIATTLASGHRAVAEVCEHRRPDHILALWALPSGDWAMRAGRRFGIPYSIWALGSDIWTLARMPGLRQYTAHVLRKAARLFADGYELAAEVEQISQRPCAFLPSCRRFGPTEGRRPRVAPPYRLAFLGRWHPNKGIDMLLDALGHLGSGDWARIEAIRIHGGGPLAVQIQTGVTALRRASRPVEVGGYLDLEGAVRLFEWADYVLIPSRIESIPVVFSDAMQAGRPVIASPVGDLPRLVNTLRCGILAERADVPALVEAIREALALSPLGFREQMSEAASMFNIRGAVASFLESIG